MSVPIRLSFCIPVYNFGAFVGETIASVLVDVGERQDVEIIVLDGASTDDTPAVMAQLTAHDGRIRYLRQNRRGGIDADLAATVQAARGEYCWLLSGDDTLRPGAVAGLLARLDDACDVYLCEHTQCDRDMTFLHDYPVFADRRLRRCDLGDAGERLGYLAAARNTEALFSFMSGVIVRRSTWLALPEASDFMGSCWAHVARLLQCDDGRLMVCYVGECWVNRRGDNDSFLEQGVVRRLALAVDGYHRIANRYYGNVSPEAAQIRRLVRADLRLILFMHAKALTCEQPARESRIELDRLVRTAFSDKTTACRVAKAVYFGTPVWVYRALRVVRRLFKRMPNSGSNAEAGT